jgi:hypothetical protein
MTFFKNRGVSMASLLGSGPADDPGPMAGKCDVGLAYESMSFSRRQAAG